MRIAVVGNLRLNQVNEDQPEDVHAEQDAPSTLEAIVAALAANGYHSEYIEGDRDVLDRLDEAAIDLVFNVSEGRRGESREAHVPAMLEMAGRPYTGSGVLALAIALDKAQTKRILASEGILTPPGQLFKFVDEPLRPDLDFPLFVKPVREGSGMGVKPSSRVETEFELRRELERVICGYQQPALVEVFLPGREFTVGLLGNGASAEALPIMEADTTTLPEDAAGVYGYRAKFVYADRVAYACPARISRPEADRIEGLALATFRALECRDVGRIDIRLGASGQPYVLEVNPLPGLAPGFSDLVLIAKAAGLAYEELIASIVEHAVGRYPAHFETATDPVPGRV